MQRWIFSIGLLLGAFVTSVVFGQEATVAPGYEYCELGCESDCGCGDICRLPPTCVRSWASPITFGGEFRARGAFAAGENIQDAERNGTWADNRLRIGLNYEFQRDVTAFAQLQGHWASGSGGSPTYGQYSSPLAPPFGFYHGEAVDQVSVYQAGVQMDYLFGSPAQTLIFGRQEIVLGNQFQFGNADWYNGWSFDALAWDWENGPNRLTAIMAKLSSNDLDLNQLPSYSRMHDDDDLFALYFTRDLSASQTVDLYWIYVNGHGRWLDPQANMNSVGSMGNNLGGATFGANAYYHTFGFRWGGEMGRLDHNVEFAFQTGIANGTARRTINSATFEGEAGYTLNTYKNLRVYTRVLWAGGPTRSQTGYVPLYTNRHSNEGFRARYGLMDLIPLTNVVTPQIGCQMDVGRRSVVGATVLWAYADRSFYTGNTNYGCEVDLWGELRYSESLSFGAGCAFLSPGTEGQALWRVGPDTFYYSYLQGRLIF